MRALIACAMLGLLAVPGASSTHGDPCVPTSADPASYLTITIGDRIFYDEERGNPLGTPVPLSGFFFGPDGDGDGIPELLEGQGTWFWEETNGLPGLQRGGAGVVEEVVFEGVVCPIDELLWFMFCNNDFEDPINDETCHVGPDDLVL